MIVRMVPLYSHTALLCFGKKYRMKFFFRRGRKMWYETASRKPSNTKYFIKLKFSEVLKTKQICKKQKHAGSKSSLKKKQMQSNQDHSVSGWISELKQEASQKQLTSISGKSPKLLDLPRPLSRQGGDRSCCSEEPFKAKYPLDKPAVYVFDRESKVALWPVPLWTVLTAGRGLLSLIWDPLISPCSIVCKWNEPSGQWWPFWVKSCCSIKVSFDVWCKVSSSLVSSNGLLLSLVIRVSDRGF